jgi:Membrane bound beta barrel domain (DUF5777)
MIMKGKFLLLVCLASLKLFAQNDSTVLRDTTSAPPAGEMSHKKKWSGEKESSSVFQGQRLINTKTVEVLHKGVMAFTVVHTFGDIAGTKGGFHNFFGLDEVSDAQIGFQIGLGNRLNLLLQHTVGGGDGIFHFYEAGLKYQFLRQQTNGSPFSVTGYANIVSTGQKATQLDSMENSFISTSDRFSEFFQLMVGRRFGAVSVQLSGTLLHTNLVIPGDQNTLGSIGAAIRLPLTKSLFVISDYFHSFRSDESTAAWKSRGFTPRDVFGIGVEILTAGHVFHINFTNARNILENRFLPRTTDSWGKGQFRWGFTLTRNFMIFHDKKDR